MADDLKSYKSSAYDTIDKIAAAKAGIPVSLLSGIRLKGEKSNADQVSNVGAATVYQIIPSTRDALLKRYGVDAYKNPQSAALAAAYHLKESLDRNKGDQVQAVGEYIGGTDRKNWGKTTKAYIQRVTGQSVDGGSDTFDQQFNAALADIAPSKPKQSGLQQAMKDYQAGKMGKDDAAAFANLIKSGQVIAPESFKLKAEHEVKTLPADAVAAYNNGDMSETDMAAFEKLAADTNRYQLPQGAQLKRPATMTEKLGMGKGGLYEPVIDTAKSAYGGLEAGLSTIGGGLAGAVGAVGGFARGLGEDIASGNIGTPKAQAANMAEYTAQKFAEPFAPVTEKGKQYVGAIADTLGNPDVAGSLNAIAPLAAESAVMQTLARGAAPQVATRAAPVMQKAGQVAQGIESGIAKAAAPVGEAVQQAGQRVAGGVKGAAAGVKQKAMNARDIITGRAAVNETPSATASARSMGAAEVTPETLRATAAEDLGFTGEKGLTKAQVTRDQGAQQFERETAKLGDVGAPIRNRYANQTEHALQTFDQWVEDTGAQAPELRATGKVVTDALANKANAMKKSYQKAYQAAEKSGEMQQPVELPELVAHLNDAVPDVATAPIIDSAIKKAVRLGIAELDDNGDLVAKSAPLKNVEEFRKWIGGASDPMHAPNTRQVTIMKGLIDTGTENAGGNAYKYARRLYKNYANEFKNSGLVSSLLRMKPGTTDRAVALEDIFNKSMLNSSLDDVRKLRRTLQTAGDEGSQAWRELQGQTMQKIRDSAFGGTMRDERGNLTINPGQLEKTLRSLDSDGKLDFIFGKQGAEKIRQLSDVANTIFTAPPGSVNTSNTASALRVALDSAVTGFTTGVPLPVATAMKELFKLAKNRKTYGQIREHLNYKPGGF